MKPRVLSGAFILFAGFFCASAGKLIAYFYTKPVFYLTLTFIISTLALYLISRLSINTGIVKKYILYLSGAVICLSPLFIYFLYFIRPHTYYFSLIAIPGAVVVILASCMLGSGIKSQPGGLQPVQGSPGKERLFDGILFTAGYLPAIISPMHILLTTLLIIVTFMVLLLLLVAFIRVDQLSGIPVLISVCFLSSGFTWYTWYNTPPLKFFNEQSSYEDMVVFHTRTYRHDLTMVQWKKYYWLFMDGLKNLSSADDYLFYEPFIHPAVNLCDTCRKVLVLGGENGCAVRELLKYQSIDRIDVVPYDTAFLAISRSNKIFREINDHSLTDNRVHFLSENIDRFITSPGPVYDLVVIDLPDPRSLEYNQFYIRRFYRYCYERLNEKGILVTQAGSPFYAPEAYVAIRNTIKDAGFTVIPLHNQVMTLSEWGWIIGCKNARQVDLMDKLNRTKFQGIRTRWLDQEAMKLISSFGKSPDFSDTTSVNTLENPVVFNHYRESQKALEGP